MATWFFANFKSAEVPKEVFEDGFEIFTQSPKGLDFPPYKFS
jgi:hypothetical protein